MSNYDVAKKWHDQIKDSGHSLNVFYEHEVIYSYGYHFPMALITKFNYEGKNIVLVNSNTYSNSTAKHLSHVRSVCNNDATIEMPTDLLKKFMDILRYNGDTKQIVSLKKEVAGLLNNEIAENENKLKRARVEWSKNNYKRQIDNRHEQLQVLAVI